MGEEGIMHIKSKYNWLKHFDFMVVDVLALIISFSLAYLFKFGNLSYLNDETWMKLLLVMCMLSVVITFFVNPYSGILRRSYYQEIIRSLQLAIYNLVLSTVVVYFFKVAYRYSREVFFTTYGIYFVLSTLMKYGWKKLLVTGKVKIKTTKEIPLFVISSKENTEKTIKSISAGDFKLYDIKGVYLIDGDTSFHLNDSVPVVDEPVEYVLHHNISEVLVDVEPNRVSKETYERLAANGIGVNLVVETMLGFQPEDQYIQNFGVYKSLSIGPFTFTPGQALYLWVKRVFDIIVGLVGVILLVPVTGIVKLAYVLSGDRTKIFYRQKRVGQDGKIIRIWKFRSMVPNADEVLKELLKDPEYKRQWDENQKFDNDPRITKVGRILRKTSVDELPQLLNVLVGDMSLVGPRPLVEGELEAHGGLKLYQKVKPGITGWWGCNGRSNIDYRERLDLEYYYVKHCSLYLDLLTIARTILAIIKKDGAQ